MSKSEWQKERTSVSITKSLKNELQQIVDLYRVRYDRNIPIGKVVEFIIHNDKEITSLYNEVKEK